MHFNFKMNCISFNQYLAQFLSKEIYLFFKKQLRQMSGCILISCILPYITDSFWFCFVLFIINT